MSGKVRGEYWIIDGRAEFADGDVGDQNHEMVALNSVAADYLDALLDYAEELGVDTEEIGIHDEPFTTATELMRAIYDALLERGVASVKASEWIIKRLEANMEVYKLLAGGGDARLHVMKHKGWIAVRSNNIEIFGYDQENKRNVVGGIEEILDQEGIEEPDEEVEFNLYDHKTGRSAYLTLADMKGENQMRPHTLPNTTYNRPLLVPADRSKPMGSQSPRSADAITRNAMKTSESKVSFRQWLLENHGSFMARRTWPSLIVSGTEEPESPACRKSRRVRRR